MTESREWLIEWVRDAHAMEEQAETMLSEQADRLENYPELKDRIQVHMEETRTQAARLKSYLDGMSEGSSTFKDASAKMMAMAQRVAGAFAGDEVMKGSLAGYTFEHMEIASYTALIAAAEAQGDTALVRICEENLREEVAMAEWLKSRLPATTTEFLQRADADSDAAKR